MTQSESSSIKTRIDGPVGWLVLNAPERRNALSLDMYASIPGAVATLTADPAVRCVVVTGAGTEAFGAGSDISEFSEKRIGGGEMRFANTEGEAHRALRNVAVPTLAMIHGHCRGGGLALALTCDLRFADTASTFAVPPAKLGLGFPVEGIESLVAVVGDATARQLLLTACTFDAQQALRSGLVNELADPSDLAQLVDQQTTAISRLAPLTVAALKMGLNAVAGTADREAANKASADCYASDDYREGIAAFMEKRHPEFGGH